MFEWTEVNSVITAGVFVAIAIFVAFLASKKK